MHYIPKYGDLVWLDFDPQTGHEQSGTRPALIITPFDYNKNTSLALSCPITSQIKSYPFEVLLPSNLPINGVILCDQIKSLDWKKRHAKFIGKLPKILIEEVIDKVTALITI